MATNFHSEGVTLSIPAPATLSSGDVVVAGNLIGIAATDAASGDLVAVTVEGVFTLPVASALDVSLGDPLYWDAADGELNDDDQNNPLVGYAVAAAGVGVTTVPTKLTP